MKFSLFSAKLGSDGLPLPPGRLRFDVAGTRDAPWFLKSGLAGKVCLEEALEPLGFTFAGKSVLDFGCGCGRVLRHWKDTPATFYGRDYNPQLVKWVGENLPFASVGRNQLEPPLDFPEVTFDLIYAFSVFTHWTEPLQRAWRDELHRILKPGGLLAVSLHGEHYRKTNMRGAEWAAFDRGELVVKAENRAGANHCVALHPRGYSESLFGQCFELVSYLEKGARGNPEQDLGIWRKRP